MRSGARLHRAIAQSSLCVLSHSLLCGSGVGQDRPPANHQDCVRLFYRGRPRMSRVAFSLTTPRGSGPGGAASVVSAPSAAIARANPRASPFPTPYLDPRVRALIGRSLGARSRARAPRHEVKHRVGPGGA
jgi:hypothetical protein